MKTIVVNEGNRNIINEAFRVLRSNMDFMASKDNNQHVFVLTSFNPGSGKSFLAINIAISFAIKKKKILVIDGRPPAQNRLFLCRFSEQGIKRLPEQSD